MRFRHIPTISLLLITILFSASENVAISANDTHLKMRTVVIDPGHGGKDPGCVRNGVFEKDIVLSVALKLGKMIQDSLPGVNVIFTRCGDEFVELQERADIANRAKADIFISIHINATKSNQPKGSETFCMGLNMSEDNMEVCQMENSVITLEDDYTSKYEGFDPKSPESYIIFSLLQNSNLEQSLKLAENIQNIYKNGPVSSSRGVRQAGFVVLWRCTSPAVLTELGFLTNDEDFKVLSNSRNHHLLASNIFKAVKIYRDKYEYSTVREESSITNYMNRNDDSQQYAIQIMSSHKIIENGNPELKGIDCYRIKVGNTNKYLTGRYSSKDDAMRDLPQIKEFFNEAFVTTIPR